MERNVKECKEMKKTTIPRDTLPYIILRRRLYIFPTGYGFLFLLTLFAMLVGSINYNNNLGFIMTFLLGSMFFISLFHSYMNLHGLKLISIKSNPVFAGDYAFFELLFRNSSRTRFAIRPYLNKMEKMPFDDFNTGDSVLRVSLKTARRGYLRPERISLESVYPFGLVRSWTHIEVPMHCLVYPRSKKSPFKAGWMYGEDEKDGLLERRGTEDFKGMRAYQAGDSMNHISWKTLSRGQGLMTKEFVNYSGKAVRIDLQLLNFGDLDDKISWLTDMILLAEGDRRDYALYLAELKLGPSQGPAHRHECLKALALYKGHADG